MQKHPPVPTSTVGLRGRKAADGPDGDPQDLIRTMPAKGTRLGGVRVPYGAWGFLSGSVRSIRRHTVSMSIFTWAMEARPESQVISAECQVCSITRTADSWAGVGSVRPIASRM